MEIPVFIKSANVATSEKPHRFEGLSQRLILQAASGHLFLVVCSALALICSLCAFPVIPIIVSACLISPRRWRSIALSIAFGCALGATILVTLFHFFGWALIYKYFPEFLNHPAWQNILNWVANYSGIGLLAIAASPLPEMPALIILGVTKPDTAIVFFAVLTGKVLKYGLIAWLASRFPERLTDGLNGFLQKFWLRKNGCNASNALVFPLLPAIVEPSITKSRALAQQSADES
jgi:membrane protein YqaA with SNARE-associated domain